MAIPLMSGLARSAGLLTLVLDAGAAQARRLATAVEGEPAPGVAGTTTGVDVAAGSADAGLDEALLVQAQVHELERGTGLSQLWRGVGELVEDGVERVSHVVDEVVDDVPELFNDIVEESVDLVEEALGHHRRVWEEDGHAQIEVRGVDRPGNRALRERLKHAIENLEGVQWAEVNAITKRVAVGFSGDADVLSALLGVIEGAEEAHGVRKERFDDQRAMAKWEVERRADHPSDIEPVHREIAALVGDSIGLGLSIAGKLVRWPKLPVEAASILSFVDNQPTLRAGIERALGRRTADLVLPLSLAAASGLAQGPTGILVDMAYRGIKLGELQARRHAWLRREPEFYSNPSDDPIHPPDLEPRPVPLPDGPVEQWSQRLSLASIAAFAATVAATGDPRRGADAFLAGMPKAARLGREAFAAQLGRSLAARGVVPLDARALRRLDRVDTVVLDSAMLLTGRTRLDRVDILVGQPDVDLTERARDLLDVTRGEEVQVDGPWRLEPFAGVVERTDLPRGTKARAREIRQRGGRPLALSRDGQVVAVACVIPELDPGTGVVLRSIREAGHRLVIAGSKGGVAKAIGADATIPRGKTMGTAIRRLQADGAVVLVVARRGKRGLAAADVAVGLTRSTGRPPWAADLLAGHELIEAAFVIDATTVAATISRRSATLAIAGSAIGALSALSGPRRRAGSRAMLMVNGAAAAALATGTWKAAELGRQPRPQLPDPVDWHSLTVGEALAELESREGGLSSNAARHRLRAERQDEREAGVVEPFLAELANPLTPILGAGAGLSAAVGSMVDAAMVGSLIGINTVVGGLQRLRTERAVAGLLRTTENEARVLRDGQEVILGEDGLVRGDVVLLGAGDAVPADCRILEASALEVDESSLTGESLPVEKGPGRCDARHIADRRCMLYEDTVIAAGSAKAVVVATGAATQAGRSLAIAAQAAPRSGVEVRLEGLTRRIMPGAAIAAAAVAGTGVLRRWSVRDIVSSSVSLAVASVPEGLPFVATAAQLASARRLSERNALVRNPRTIEALGRVDVLCFDKTGTLTEGRIHLRGVSDGLDPRDVDHLDEHARRIIATALRATPEPGDAETPANETDLAVLRAARDHGVVPTEGCEGWSRITELPFESARGLYAVLGRDGGDQLLSVKGAPEAVLPQCLARRTPSGEVIPLDDTARAALDGHVEDLARRGHRIIAVAERDASGRTELDNERVQRLELHGFLALADPVRAAGAEAVKGVQDAGVHVVMITGDHPSTAQAIAGELGILNGHRVLSGAELDDLGDEALAKVIDEVAVFARVTPGQKVRIVQAFQRSGHAVAMTGDGANDAPSIRLADVGVALGGRGTPAARDAADLVVTDDRIETIIDAIVEGRALWGSVREALAILVGGNLGEIGFAVCSSMLSPRPSMNGRQVLLVNLLTDLAPAMAIAVRPPADKSPETLLREGPESSLGQALTRDIAVRAITTAGGANAAWLAARLTGGHARASTVGLVALVGTQLGQTVLAGAGGRSPLVVATGVGSAAAMAGIVQTPGLSHFFGCRPLGPLDWAQAVTAATVATCASAVATRFLPSSD